MPDDGQERGMLGDGQLQAGKYNLRLVERALRNEWPIDPKHMALVVTQSALIVGRSENDRNKVAAMKVLIAADAANLKRAEMQLRMTEDAPGTQVNVQIVNSETIQRAHDEEPEYLEWLRQKALTEAGGNVAGNIPGHGRNGSANGNGNGKHD